MPTRSETGLSGIESTQRSSKHLSPSSSHLSKLPAACRLGACIIHRKDIHAAVSVSCGHKICRTFRLLRNRTKLAPVRSAITSLRKNLDVANRFWPTLFRCCWFVRDRARWALDLPEVFTLAYPICLFFFMRGDTPVDIVHRVSRNSSPRRLLARLRCHSALRFPRRDRVGVTV